MHGTYVKIEDKKTLINHLYWLCKIEFSRFQCHEIVWVNLYSMEVVRSLLICAAGITIWIESCISRPQSLDLQKLTVRVQRSLARIHHISYSGKLGVELKYTLASIDFDANDVALLLRHIIVCSVLRFKSQIFGW